MSEELKVYEEKMEKVHRCPLKRVRIHPRRTCEPACT